MNTLPDCLQTYLGNFIADYEVKDFAPFTDSTNSDESDSRPIHIRLNSLELLDDSENPSCIRRRYISSRNSPYHHTMSTVNKNYHRVFNHMKYKKITMRSVGLNETWKNIINYSKFLVYLHIDADFDLFFVCPLVYKKMKTLKVSGSEVSSFHYDFPLLESISFYNCSFRDVTIDFRLLPSLSSISVRSLFDSEPVSLKKEKYFFGLDVDPLLLE